MVKRWLGSLLLMAVVGSAWAGFLPFQLDAPKHDNPVDPYNPANLNKLYAQATSVAVYTAIPVVTQTPTQTPCGGCTPTNTPTVCACTPTPVPTPTVTACAGCAPAVVATHPGNGVTVEVPYLYTGSDDSYNASHVEVVFFFNQTMDASTYYAPMAVTISPACSFSVGWVDSRSLIVYLSTVPSGPSNTPLQLNSTYTIGLGTAIKSIDGQALMPSNTSFSTGSFKFVGFFDAWTRSQGVFNTQNTTSAYFNAPLDTSIPLAGKISSSPNIISGLNYYYSNGNVTNYVQLTTCLNPVPNQLYTFSYNGGNKDPLGATAGAVTPTNIESSSFSITYFGAPTFPSSSPSIDFNYPFDTTATAAAISLLSGDSISTSYNSSGCYQSLSISRVGGWTPGTTYTLIVGTGARSLNGSQNLASPAAFTWVEP